MPPGGAIAPKGALFPAPILNRDAFAAWAGFPIRQIHAILGFWIAGALWLRYGHIRKAAAHGGEDGLIVGSSPRSLSFSSGWLAVE
jgi:hypothetical protein